MPDPFVSFANYDVDCKFPHKTSQEYMNGLYYILPQATTTSLGGIRLGEGLAYNPASGQVDALAGVSIKRATAMPSVGSYVLGDYFENSAPAVLGTLGSQYVVVGWKRLTTGTTNIANTDWVECRALTGT